MIKWITKKPPQNESRPILAQVDFTADDIETLLCIIDKDEDVINWNSGDGTDWDSTCIDRWIPLSEFMDLLNGGNFVRDPVLWFAEQMEKKLRENDHKGGWDDSTTVSLIRRCREELNELTKAEDEFDRAKILTDGRESYREEVIRECADVANFAMMIADNVRNEEEE